MLSFEYSNTAKEVKDTNDTTFHINLQEIEVDKCSRISEIEWGERGGAPYVTCTATTSESVDRLSWLWLQYAVSSTIAVVVQ